MSFEERKQTFIEEYKQAKLQNKLQRWEDNFQDDYEDAIEAEGLDFDAYLDEIVSEGNKSTDEGPQYFPPAQVDKIDKEYLKNIKYGKGNLKYDNLISNFNLKLISPNFTYIKDIDDLDTIINQLEIVIQLLTKQGMEGVSELQEVIIKLSHDVAMMPDPSKLKKITMTIDGILDEFHDVDILLANDRHTIYDFWDKVNNEWKGLEVSWKAFKKELEATEFWQTEHGLEIPTLPQYVIPVNSPRIKLEKEELRLLKIMELLGGELPMRHLNELEEGASSEAKNYLTQLQRPGPNTEQQERIDTPPNEKIHDRKHWEQLEGKVVIHDAPKAIDNSQMEDIFGRNAADWKEKLGAQRNQMSEKSLTELDLLTKNNMTVDPILYYIIEAQLFNDVSIPIASDEKVFFEEWGREFIELVKEKASDSDLKNTIEIWDTILETVGEEYDTVYLPYTDWLIELMEGEDGNIKQQVYDELNKSAKDFFAFLNDVLVESKGQFMVSQGVSDVMRGSGAPPLQAGKKTPPKTGMRMDRAQPFRSSTKRKFSEKAFNTAISNLVDSMDQYYFGPLTSNMFVEDEKPDFAEDVRNYDFRNLKMTFSKEKSVEDEREILDGYAENITITDLQHLINFFETAKKGEEESWPQFLKALEDIVDTLNEILPEKYENDNHNWAAEYAIKVLNRNHENADLNEMEFMGKKLNKYDTLTGRKPINRLRTLLQSEQMLQILRKEEKFRQISGKKLQELVNKFLELSDPRNLGKSDEVSSSIMNAYDVIRKRAGMKIYYGNLITEDIGDMDYLINRIYKENKIEINTMEIDSIVKSMDSMQNLSSNYGLSGEIIYKIKGLCR